MTDAVISAIITGFLSLAGVFAANWAPVTASGSATTYNCDGLWYNNGQTDYALVGGGWNDGLLVGSRYVHLRATAADAGTNIGSRLSFVPQTA